MGAAGVHALARAARRAHAGAARQCADGGARPLTDLPPFELGYAGTELRQQLVDAVLAGAKTTTAGLAELYEAEGEAIPSTGDRFALVDREDAQVGVVEIVDARVVPARDIDVEFARDEGEGFESVDDWRVAHERFFDRAISPDTRIVAIRFRLVERT